MSIRESYDRYHALSSNGAYGHSERFSGSVLKLLRAQSGQSLLDIGCGKGLFLEVVKRYKLHSHGIDVSIVALKTSRSKGLSVVLADAEHLPFGDNSFSLVTCIGSLEHVPNPHNAVKEMARVLDRDGKAFIFVPNSYFIGHMYLVWKTGNPPDEGGQYFSERFRTRWEWQRLLENGGLNVLGIKKFNNVLTSRRFGTLTRYFYHIFLRPFVPLNLSYAFGFLCEARH